MGNIFTDGEIQETLYMSKDILHDDWKKKTWAVEALAGYIHTKHGKGEEYVAMSRSRNGKVTGTQAIFDIGDKRITYMLVEPNNTPKPGEVHIVKMEESINEAGILDIVHQEVTQRSNKLRHNPFAGVLSGLKLSA